MANLEDASCIGAEYQSGCIEKEIESLELFLQDLVQLFELRIWMNRLYFFDKHDILSSIKTNKIVVSFILCLRMKNRMQTEWKEECLTIEWNTHTHKDNKIKTWKKTDFSGKYKWK